MSKFKFKGKDTNGQWQCGDLLHKEGKTFIANWIPEEETFLGEGYIYDVEVSPESVQLIEGDKNGRQSI